MDDLDREILDRMSSLEIDCPSCEGVGDDQYTCTVCWTQGGNGKINIVKYIQENPRFIIEK